MAKVELYDTTLRDGTQQEGVSLSVEDKLKIARKLDELGIDFIEGGWPGANPKDEEFFREAQSLELRHAKLAAFCSTRRANGSAETDPTLRHALDANTPVVTMVGKTWDMHVTHVLETNLEENLAMISDSVAFFKRHGKTVLLDAEHFFDGFKANPGYALQCVRAAADAGADTVVLCDTNGGALPHEVSAIVARVREEAPDAALAIHPHNDGDVAVANALAGVLAGATQVQGTVNGYGERCGNANLLSVIADLQIKMGYECVTDEQLRSMMEVSHYVSEIVNRTPNPYQPYVGSSAFTHKAGLHASAVAKLEESYQHIAPELVGTPTTSSFRSWRAGPTSYRSWWRWASTTRGRPSRTGSCWTSSPPSSSRRMPAFSTRAPRPPSRCWCDEPCPTTGRPSTSSTSWSSWRSTDARWTSTRKAWLARRR